MGIVLMLMSINSKINFSIFPSDLLIPRNVIKKRAGSRRWITHIALKIKREPVIIADFNAFVSCDNDISYSVNFYINKKKDIEINCESNVTV
jgi:hypothetical protein